MKKVIFILPLIIVLTGCPGGNPASQHRSVFMQRNTICFSVDKNDILNYYTVATTQHNKYKMILVGENTKLSYPETCFNVAFKNGYRYEITYGLNGKKYSDQFFIDNDGNR